MNARQAARAAASRRAGRVTQQHAGPTRAAPPPRPALTQAVVVLAGIGFGATLSTAVTTETRGELTAPGGPASFVGSLTGLAGTYLALIMILLVSRIPFVERVLGLDGLLRWHRRLAPWPISLLVAHALLLTVGYAQAARSGVWREVNTLLTRYPDMVTATVGFGLMCLAGFVSLRAIRNRLRRETWWTVHLVMYLALALSFAHALVLGPSFVNHPVTEAVWSAAWAGSAGLVLAYRIGLPLVRSLRHRLRVTQVRPEGPNVVSIVCTGRRLDRLPVAGGQFFCWRFLTPSLWWQAHPYSLSALPRPSQLRLTVKARGDHSAALATLRPGTRIVIEGPYGAFTRHAQRRRRALLIAGGIGVTALRALLEDLPKQARPIVVVRVTRPEDLVLRAEIAELTRHQRGQLHELIGSRAAVTFDGHRLARLVPDIDQRDVFICGPEGFVAATVDIVKGLGVPDEAIHHEAFAL